MPKQLNIMKETKERGILFIYIRLFYCLENQIPMSTQELEIIGKISQVLVNQNNTNLKDQ